MVDPAAALQRNQPLPLLLQDSESSTVTTTSGGAVDLGGPSLEINAPGPGLLAVMASAWLKNSGAGTSMIHLQVDAQPFGSIIATTSTLEVNMWSAPGSTTGIAGSIGGMLLTPIATGLHTVSLRYLATAGTATFHSRMLWAGILAAVPA